MKTDDFKTKRISRFKLSPNVEKDLVRDFFSNKERGFFVDVGANDPVFDSQSWHLEQLNWDGLLIEPLPDYCQKLRAHRKGRVAQVACSSPANSGKTLRLLVAGVHSTLNSAPIAMGASSEAYADVLCKTLDETLEEYGVATSFDFISIDIEGHEMEMFKGFTIDKWKPKLVLLEDHVTSHEKHRFMVGRGYQLILRTGLNSWYVPASENFTLSLVARLQYFRKYWLGLLFRKARYAR